MFSKIAVSFLCKVLEKIGFTLQPVLYLLMGWIKITKHDSASAKPVINQKFSLGFLIKVENGNFLCWLEGLLI
jgi:hypothetical protein